MVHHLAVRGWHPHRRLLLGGVLIVVLLRLLLRNVSGSGIILKYFVSKAAFKHGHHGLILIVGECAYYLTMLIIGATNTATWNTGVLGAAARYRTICHDGRVACVVAVVIVARRRAQQAHRLVICQHLLLLVQLMLLLMMLMLDNHSVLVVYQSYSWKRPGSRAML